MKTYTFITTAPRPGGAEYLEETECSLWDAGFKQWQVFSEPHPHPDPSWIVQPQRLGSWPHFLAGVREGLKSDADAIVYVQDDVRVAKGLREFLGRIWDGRPGHNFGVLSLYLDSNTTATRQEMMADGWWRIPETVSPRGACLLAMPRMAAERLFTNEFDSRQRFGTENRLFAFCRKAGLGWFYFGRQSFAQHVGVMSAVCGDRVQKPERVAGDDWIRDASHIGAA